VRALQCADYVNFITNDDEPFPGVEGDDVTAADIKDAIERYELESAVRNPLASSLSPLSLSRALSLSLFFLARCRCCFPRHGCGQELHALALSAGILFLVLILASCRWCVSWICGDRLDLRRSLGSAEISRICGDRSDLRRSLGSAEIRTLTSSIPAPAVPRSGCPALRLSRAPAVPRSGCPALSRTQAVLAEHTGQTGRPTSHVVSWSLLLFFCLFSSVL
jgi:hypothetical protein